MKLKTGRLEVQLRGRALDLTPSVQKNKVKNRKTTKIAKPRASSLIRLALAPTWPAPCLQAPPNSPKVVFSKQSSQRTPLLIPQTSADPQLPANRRKCLQGRSSTPGRLFLLTAKNNPFSAKDNPFSAFSAQGEISSATNSSEKHFPNLKAESAYFFPSRLLFL